MDWISGIQKAVDYVERNILAEIDYEEVAKQAYSSSFHFQRIFGILCGFTLGDYIRSRRLSMAGSELAVPGTKVIDVALKYGYNTPESFSRAFTRFHGVSPSQSSQNGAKLKSFSPISVKLIIDGGNVMDYRIETMDAFPIVCRKMQVSGKEEMGQEQISKFWQECGKDGTMAALCSYIPQPDIFKNCIVGASFGKDAADADYPYAIGVQYNGAPVAEDNLAVEVIPAHTYLVFICTGKMPEALADLYKQISSEFFPTSDYHPCGGTDFEVYPSADVSNPEYSCEFWVAVERKG